MKPIQPFFLTAYLRLIFFLISFHVVTAQTQKDTLLAFQYYQKADSLLIERKHDASIDYFTKALPMYQKAMVWEKVANCYNKISENQWRKRKFKESFFNAKKALEISDQYLNEENKERAYAYDNIGTYYLRTFRYEKALMYFKKSLDFKKKIFSDNHQEIGVTYSNLGITYRYLSEFQNGLSYQKKALDFFIKNFGVNHEKTGREYNNIGNIYSQMGKYHTALDYYKKNLEIIYSSNTENNINLGYNYFNIGIIYHDLNQHNKALQYYQKAMPIFEKEEDIYPLFATYNNIGTLFSDKGEHDAALEYNKKSLDMALKIYDQNQPDVGTCYWNIAVVMENKEDYEKSLFYYKKALRIYKEKYGENHEGVATLYGNIGNVYTHKKDYKKGLECHLKGIAIYNEISEKNNYEFSRAYINLANFYLEKRIFDKSIESSRKGLEILENEYGKNSPPTLQVLNQLGNIYRQQRDYDKAITYFNEAIVTNIKNYNDKKDKGIFDPSKYYNLKLLLETLQGKAKTLKLKYLESKRLLDLKQSKEIYEQANVLIDYIRQSYKNYQDKISFSKKAKEVYQDAIATHLLFENEKSLEYTLYYAEKSKANTLKELLNESTARSFGGLPKGIIALEKEIKTDRAFYQSQITGEKSKKNTIDTTKIKEFENELFNLNRKQDSLLLVLEKKYPKYFQAKYQNNVISVADIQKNLNDKTTLLEFFTSDSTTYAFIITKNTIKVKELSTFSLTNKIEQFKKAITSKDLRTYKESAHTLYNELINPIKSNLAGDELIIIPDGPLWHLNFELLLTQNDDSNNPTVLSYLLKDYAVTYANSANLLFTHFKSEIQSKTLQECLAFSFSDSTQTKDSTIMSFATLRDTGDDLPGTRKEIMAISDIIDGQYYFGSQAIEANFKKNANQYNILHLALHGEVDNEHPENSKLYFTKSKDTIEDNFLYSHELFALDIPAELTVLSACNTGMGKIAKGEGIMSLGTAFQYAGTKSLLLTSWEVSDQTTPELMKYFYTNLKEGMNKAKALQQAKLQYLHTAKKNRTHPFYWGGFYLVGDSAPIQFKSNSLLYWILGLAFLLILFSVFIFRTRKAK